MSTAEKTQFDRPQSNYPLGSAEDLHPANDLLDYVRQYAQEKPEVAALWCFGIGFVLGWKLKPW